MKKTQPKPWTRMSTSELRAATREFDSPDYEPRFQKPTAREEAILDKFMRKARRGRPRGGADTTRVQITLERRLLESADAFARRRRISRSELIARGLRLALRDAG